MSSESDESPDATDSGSENPTTTQKAPSPRESPKEEPEASTDVRAEIAEQAPPHERMAPAQRDAAGESGAEAADGENDETPAEHDEPAGSDVSVEDGVATDGEATALKEEADEADTSSSGDEANEAASTETEEEEGSSEASVKEDANEADASSSGDEANEAASTEEEGGSNEASVKAGADEGDVSSSGDEANEAASTEEADSNEASENEAASTEEADSNEASVKAGADEGDVSSSGDEANEAASTEEADSNEASENEASVKAGADEGDVSSSGDEANEAASTEEEGGSNEASVKDGTAKEEANEGDGDEKEVAAAAEGASAAESVEEPVEADDTEPDVDPPKKSKDSGRGLGKAAARGTVWVVGGFGISQLARLGGTVLLSRLLFPQAFGIMRIVNMITMIIGLISDTGLRGSVIYHKRGDDPAFLNTAWTIQSVRALLVAIVLASIASPVADFYEMPELAILLPAIAASLVVMGLSSTSVYTLGRRVNPKPVAVLEVGLRVGGLGVMIALAFVWKSVWVLAIGTIIANVGKGIVTHFFIRGYRNRWQVDREALRDQLHFGKWVFLGSALAAALNQGDSAILGKLLSAEQLGIFSFALMLSNTAPNAMRAVGRSVLQPLYAKFNTGDATRLRRRLFKVRGALMAVALPALWIVSIFGTEIVDLLFDDRYLAAGWMLRIMTVGAVASIVIATAEMIFVSAGDSFTHVVHKAFSAAFFLGGLVIGYALDDFRGLLIGMSVGRIAGYFPMAYLLRQRGAWLPRLDAMAMGSSAIVLTLGFLLNPLEIL